MWAAEQEFSVSYGFRDWSAKEPSAKQMQGHHAIVRVRVEKDDSLMSYHYTSLFDWISSFLDAHINRRFVLDINDPWFVNITNLSPIFEKGNLANFKPILPLNTSNADVLRAIPVYDPWF